MTKHAENEVPHYTIPDIQIGVGDHEFQKGMKILKRGGVRNVQADSFGWRADVAGSKAGQWYAVSVGARAFDDGACTCYLGKNDELCKHMIALAIHVVREYRPEGAAVLAQPLDHAVCSGEIRAITEDEAKNAKSAVTAALRHIKPYDGPSRTWFRYQDSLTRGCRLVLLAVSELPICERSVDIVIDILKRLDRKLMGGVDDSDGTVGACMEELVELLNLFSDMHPPLIPHINKKLPEGEVFDWQTGYQHRRE